MPGCFVDFRKGWEKSRRHTGHDITHVVADRLGSPGRKGSEDNWPGNQRASVRFLAGRQGYLQVTRCTAQGPVHPLADSQEAGVDAHQQGKGGSV